MNRRIKRGERRNEGGRGKGGLRRIERRKGEKGNRIFLNTKKIFL